MFKVAFKLTCLEIIGVAALSYGLDNTQLIAIQKELTRKYLSSCDGALSYCRLLN